MRKLAILGATGSIGRRALEFVSRHTDRFAVTILAAGANIRLLADQIRAFRPEKAVVMTEQGRSELKTLLKGEHLPEILVGAAGYIEAAASDETDTVLLAMVGAAGLEPAVAAVRSKKRIALANKETLVMAGGIVMSEARERGVEIYPVDSEHSAIFQCFQGNRKGDFSKIFLTASGGPFRRKPFAEFKDITPADALNHPNWDMGSKITVDSATLMNKGLEIIEAVHLFDVPPDAIEVLVHPQSIVHSMVGFKDGSIMAQMGLPDMKSAIAYALSVPERLDTGVGFPGFANGGALEFEKPDHQKFPAIDMAFEVCRKGGTLPAVMNAANEIAVAAFLNFKTDFPGIMRIVSECVEAHTPVDNPDLSSIIDADGWAREKAVSLT